MADDQSGSATAHDPRSVPVGRPRTSAEDEDAGGRKRRSRSLGFGAVVGLVLTVENLYLATSGVLEPNSIKENQVAVFLASNYFPAALHDPVDAMNRWGTPDFRALHAARGLESYRNWYAPVDAIPGNFVTVSRNGDSSDTFTVAVERVLRSGAHDKFQIVMRLKCTSFWQTHAPGSTCSSDNLRLDFTAVTLPST